MRNLQWSEFTTDSLQCGDGWWSCAGTASDFQTVRRANAAMCARMGTIKMSAKKNRKPAKASGPHEVVGSGEGLLDGEIAASQTDEAEQAGAEEGQGSWFWNRGRCD